MLINQGRGGSSGDERKANSMSGGGRFRAQNLPAMRRLRSGRYAKGLIVTVIT